MKVLFVINQLFKGGAETALINLLSAMSDKKYEIDLLIYDQIDLPDTVSLIPKIPPYVKVYNVAENEKKLAYIKKAIHKVQRKITGKTAYRQKVYDVLKKNRYDVAVSFGEWFSSSLVAKYANARRKYVWIHADADKADFFHPDIHMYHSLFDGFIFVSNNSKAAAEKHYSFLVGRSYIVNNMINREEVMRKAEEKTELPLPEGDLPRLVTVANVRPEKNHQRQIRVMKKLFERGLRFYWLNVGSQANAALMKKINADIRDAGLTEYFLFTGATENPYSVINESDAVTVLSDHESWSMVITEAKAIGTPVIATKTSGATEQLIHGENGIFCDFDDDDIADKIEDFLTDGNLREKIRQNLSSFSGVEDALAQLDRLLRDGKKLLYVFDDINYMSGARAATLNQAEHLRSIIDVELFSVTSPRDDVLKTRYRITDIEENERFRCLSVPTGEVLRSGEYSKRTKLLRLLYAVLVRFGMDRFIYQKLLSDELYSHFDSYDFVIVVSEASKLRHFVSRLQHPKKIQWIHTDYVAWQSLNGWTKKITAHDKKTYEKFDTVVCLSQVLRDKFISLYPALSDKTLVIPNLIDGEEIRRKASEKLDFSPDRSKLNLITIGRMEAEKRYDRILSVAKELKARGVDFSWYLVGDGPLLESHKALAGELDILESVIFAGYMKNVCPLLKECDVFVLLSEYEGTPVTIDEAKVLGVPVLARDVGGISDQLEDGKYGKALAEIGADDIISFIDNNSRGNKDFSAIEYNNKIHIMYTELLEDVENEAIVCD